MTKGDRLASYVFALIVVAGILFVVITWMMQSK